MKRAILTLSFLYRSCTKAKDERGFTLRWRWIQGNHEIKSYRAWFPARRMQYRWGLSQDKLGPAKRRWGSTGSVSRIEYSVVPRSLFKHQNSFGHACFYDSIWPGLFLRNKWIPLLPKCLSNVSWNKRRDNQRYVQMVLAMLRVDFRQLPSRSSFDFIIPLETGHVSISFDMTTSWHWPSSKDNC